MKTINYVFIGLLVLMLIGSSICMFFIGGYTSKAISIIIITMAVAMVTNGIHHNFIVKEKQKDERNISIETKSKAKAFDAMGIIFGLLIIIYGMLKYNLLIILLAVVAYSIIFIVYMTCLSKYHQEM